jgi:MFS family permease
LPEETVGPEPDDDWARSPRRLRDLRGRNLVYTVVLLVLVLTPFAVALVRAFREGWVPSGDEANIATRALDVLSRHPPRTGLPSTSVLYGDQISTNHPGPIEFYLIAIPLRLFGQTAGPLLTAAAINAGFGLIALWVFFRRLGLTAMLWAGILLLAVNWSGGTSVLTDTLSSNMTMYALLATAVLAWALIDGDLRLLPLTVFVASYAAQQHLAAGFIVAILGAAVTIALVLQIIVRVRRGDTSVWKLTRRWWFLGLVVVGVCWAPVALDEVRGHPGNLTEIAKFARDKTRATLGLRSGVYQTLHAVVPPTILAHTDISGVFFLPRLGTTWFALGGLVGVALVVVAWGARRRSRSLSRLAIVALVLLAAGVVNGGNVPASVESWRVNLYRWTWAGVFLTWTAIGLGFAFLAERIAARRSISERSFTSRAQALAPTTLLVIAALIATSIAFVGGSDDHNREEPAFRLEKHVGSVVLAKVDRRHPVVVVGIGFAGGLSVAPYVIFRLVEAGLRVETPPGLDAAYGAERNYDPNSGAQAILVSSGETKLPKVPGTLISNGFFSPERSALIAKLAVQAKGVKVVLAHGAREAIDRTYTGVYRYYVDSMLKQLPTNPRAVIDLTTFQRFVLNGWIVSPALDVAKVKRLSKLPSDDTSIGGDTQVQVRLLTPAQLEETRVPGL